MSCGLVVFAKAPEPGLVKTRLIPALGAQGAARLAERFLEHALEQALAAELGPVELCIAPGSGHPFVDALASRTGLPIAAQGEGDLGARMSRALDRMRERCGAALLLGTDAPALDAEVLRQAAGALASAPAVCVPTHDGGYVLLGLRVAAPGLFDGMQWSHGAVLQDTRDRARSAGLALIELAPLHDVDLPQDLIHVPPSWAERLA